MPPNDPDPIFAAFYEACEREAHNQQCGRAIQYEAGRTQWDAICEAARAEPAAWSPDRMARNDERLAAFHAECAAWTPDDPPPVFYGDSMVNLKWTAPPPPCIRHEASRVYRWLILTIVVAGIMAVACNVKGCEGETPTTKGGSNG